MKIVSKLLFISTIASLAIGATYAYFSDAETSTGNTFAAGTLDLDVNGNNGSNTVKFAVSNMKPGSQVIKTWTLNNVGSLDGYLDLENISVANSENGCEEPELEAGDVSCDNPGEGQGELQEAVSLSKLFWDDDCDGWVGTGETVIYDGKLGNIASHYEENRFLGAGKSQCVTAQINWWAGADDNKTMGDGATLSLEFELAQTTGQ